MKRTMERLLIRGAALVTGGAPPRRAAVFVARGKIRAVGHAAEALARKGGARRIDLEGGYLTPGFLDLHTHGAIGVDFVEAGREDLARAMRHYVARGVTSLLVSIYPAAPAKLIEVLERLSGYLNEGVGGGIAIGFHLEGPYLSPRRPGALPSEHFRTFRKDEAEGILRAAGGLARTMTMAPELPGGHELIRWLIRRRVVPSFGHSDAGYKETRKAIAAGVRHATHLFNAMAGIHHRAPGPVPALLEDPRVFVELIADGHHVDPTVLKLVHASKARSRVILVSDSVEPCGLADGRYSFAGKPVELREGRVTLLDGTLAGSALTLDRAVSLHVKKLGIPIEEAILLVTSNPARLLGQERLRGEVRPGRRADLVHLDEGLRVRATWVGGELVHGKA